MKHKIEEMLRHMPAKVREDIEARTASIVTGDEDEENAEKPKKKRMCTVM